MTPDWPDKRLNRCFHAKTHRHCRVERVLMGTQPVAEAHPPLLVGLEIGEPMIVNGPADEVGLLHLHMSQIAVISKSAEVDDRRIGGCYREPTLLVAEIDPILDRIEIAAGVAQLLCFSLDDRACDFIAGNRIAER